MSGNRCYINSTSRTDYLEFLDQLNFRFLLFFFGVGRRGGGGDLFGSSFVYFLCTRLEPPFCALSIYLLLILK